MTPLVFVAVLGAALLHAVWNAMVKSGEDQELDAIAVALGAGLVGAASLLVLSPPAFAAWPWMVASALVHVAYFALLGAAYRWGELTHVYPIMRGGGPLIVAVLSGPLLGERLPGVKSVGVGLICVGILAFAAGRYDRRAIGLAAANAAVIATYTLVDGYGARVSAAPFAYTAWTLALSAVGIALISHAWRGPAALKYVAARWKWSVAGGASALGSYAIALWAMTLAPVAAVAAIRETSVLFAAFIGWIVLREPPSGRKLTGTGLVLAGLIALRL
jgi:drug/metabolite transporter (DMT)-like permease